MSHFAVLVIGDNIDEQLEKFDENLDTPRYVKYTKEQLIAEKKKEIEDYKNSTYAEYLADPEAYEAECKNPNHVEYLKNDFPKKLEMTDEQIYIEAVKWYEADEIGPDGEVYSSYNPNSKWDWYEIGGRYAGRLILKEGVEKEEEPNFSWGWDAKATEEVLKEPRVDTALVGNIDWTKMHLVQSKYDDAIRFWEMKIEGAKPETEEEKEQLTWDWYKPEFYTERYKNKETFAKSRSSFTMWAIVKDGEWFEKGSMGFWAMSNETDDEALDWEMNMYDRFIKDLPADTRITVVDCHI
jgi:hypothetical protein